MMIKANSPYRFTVVNEGKQHAALHLESKSIQGRLDEVTTARCTGGCGEQLVSATIELLAEMAGRP
jgi:hypothetical protein